MPNDLSAFDATKFSTAVIANLDRINVMRPLVNTDVEGDLTQNSTVYVRTLGNISMSAYTGSISYEDLAPAKEAFTVSDQQHFAFAVDDKDVAQNDLSALDLYASRAATKMTDVIEEKILSQYVKAHVDNRITGAASAAIALTTANVYEYFVNARTRLSKKNVPQTGRWAIVDPDSYALLLRCPEFTRATAQGDSTVVNGSVGRIAGFDIYESNAVPVIGGGTPGKFLIFGDKDAITYAGQIMSVEPIRLESKFATAIRGLLLHDATVFAENSKRLAYIKAAI